MNIIKLVWTGWVNIVASIPGRLQRGKTFIRTTIEKVLESSVVEYVGTSLVLSCRRVVKHASIVTMEPCIIVRRYMYVLVFYIVLVIAIAQLYSVNNYQQTTCEGRCNGLELCTRRISCFHAFWCFPWPILVWGPDLFSGGRKEGRKGLETLAAFPCALGMSIS